MSGNLEIFKSEIFKLRTNFFKTPYSPFHHFKINIMYNTTAQYELAPEFEALFETEFAAEYLSPEGEAGDAPGRVSGVIGQDTRKRIATTTTPPFSYICQIRLKLGSNWFVGTGTKIGPRTVLTAGHNVWDDAKNKMVDPATVFVAPGRNGSKTPLGVFGVEKIIMSDPKFDNSSIVTARDYAILKLKDGGKPAVKKQIEAIGCWGGPIQKPDTVGTSVLKKHLPADLGVLTVNLCGYPTDRNWNGSFQVLSYNKTVRIDKASGLLHYQNDTFSGNSGSPVWVRRSPDLGGRVLVGIHIRVGDRSKAGRPLTTAGVFINDAVRKFISDNRNL